MIKPIHLCPLCEERPRHYSSGKHGNAHQYGCPKCGLKAPDAPLHEEAAQNWNQIEELIERDQVDSEEVFGPGPNRPDPDEDTHADLLLIHAMMLGEWDEVSRLADKLDEQNAAGIHPDEIEVFECNPSEGRHA